MLSLIYFYHGSNENNALQISCGLYMVTSLVYGCVIGLMPILCSKVFGPSIHSHVTMLYQEQSTFI